MRIYVINLDRSPERMAFMRDQLEALSLDFERVAAVDGQALDAQTLERHGLKSGGTACFMSHRRVWEKLASSADTHALVLEDDAELSPLFRAVASSAEWVPPQADLVKIEVTGEKLFLSTEAIGLGDGRRLRRLHATSCGSAGYVISRAAAQRLLDATGDFTIPVDMFMFGEPFLRQAGVYQMLPSPVRQRSMLRSQGTGAFRSTIDTDRFDGPPVVEPALKPNLKRKLLRELVRPFRQAHSLWRRAVRADRFKPQRVEFG